MFRQASVQDSSLNLIMGNKSTQETIAETEKVSDNSEGNVPILEDSEKTPEPSCSRKIKRRKSKRWNFTHIKKRSPPLIDISSDEPTKEEETDDVAISYLGDLGFPNVPMNIPLRLKRIMTARGIIPFKNFK